MQARRGPAEHAEAVVARKAVAEDRDLVPLIRQWARCVLFTWALRLHTIASPEVFLCRAFSWSVRDDRSPKFKTHFPVRLIVK